KIAGGIGRGFHDDAIDTSAVGLFDSDKDIASDGGLGDRIHHLPGDSGIVRTDLAGRECGFQAELPVTFLDYGSASIEINIEVHGLPGGNLNGAANDSTGRDLQPGVGLTAEIQLMNRTIGEDHTVVAIAGAGVCRRDGRASRHSVGNEKQANLLIATYGKTCRAKL